MAGIEPAYRISSGKGRLPRALSYLVDVKVDGTHALTWMGNAPSASEAASLAVAALRLALGAIAAGTGGSAPKIREDQTDIEVTPYDWKSESTHWNLSGGIAARARGTGRARDGRKATGRMAAALLEPILLGSDSLTPSSEVKLSIWGPADDGSITSRVSDEHMAKGRPRAHDLGAELEDPIALGIWHAARRHKDGANTAVNMITPLPRNGSASLRAAITSGAASSFADDLARAREITALIRKHAT